jgi:protein-tyrosine phosphatase
LNELIIISYFNVFKIVQVGISSLSRVHKFKGSSNFRDIGGINGEQAFPIKRGLIFRSDDLSSLSGNDLTRLAEYKINLICDLRSPEEIKRKPNKIIDVRIKQVNVPFFQTNPNFSQKDFLGKLASDPGSIDFEKLMFDLYHRIVFEEHNKIAEVFNYLSEENHLPAVIHCSAGKDRTGIIAALIQLFLGAAFRDVIQDYMLSNDLNNRRAKERMRFIRFISFFRISYAKMKPMFEARREYLETVLEDLLNEYGTVENYLKAKCCVPECNLEKLRLEMLDKNLL